jgi:hypothetical protein
MSVRPVLCGTVAAIAMVVLAASVVLADTCCANTPVGFQPSAARPGTTVRVTGIRCLNADNSGPLPVVLDGFWLWSGHRAADAHPDTVPAPGLPEALPDVGQWLPFESVRPAADGSGVGAFTVPRLADGTYQIWWICNNDQGPGSGIHYGTGSRLTVGAPPETAAVGPTASPRSAGPEPALALLFGLSAGAFVLTLVSTRFSRRSP